MAIGGYTTAILMIDHGVKDIATIPFAIVVAGVAGVLFGLPAARLSGLYLALATFAIAVATPAVIKRFEGFTGGGTGVNLFGTPELTASLTPVEILGLELNFNNWLYYLVAGRSRSSATSIAWLILRGRTGRAFRAVRDSETAGRLVGHQPHAYEGARLRHQRRLRRRRRGALRDRDDVRQPGHVPGRRSRSCCSSASSSAGSAR